MNVHVSTGPKDYSHLLNDGKIKGKCKGLRINAEVEENVTHENRIKLIKNLCGPITINSTQFQIQKNHDILVKSQEKVWDFEFNKRQILNIEENWIDTLPYGY